MLKLKEIKIIQSKKELETLPEGKLLINTINAHSYNTALKDAFFAEALMKGDALIPDGASIVMAKLKARCQSIKTHYRMELIFHKLQYSI